MDINCHNVLSVGYTPTLLNFISFISLFSGGWGNMNQIHSIKYRNNEIEKLGVKLKQEVIKLLKKYDGLMMGAIVVSSDELPPTFEIMDKVRVINYNTCYDEMKVLTEFIRTVKELNAVFEVNPYLKKIIVRSSDRRIVNILLNYYAKEVLEEKYNWSVKIYEEIDTTYIPLNKIDYTYKLFKKELNKNSHHILLNKYFIGFDNGDNTYFIDFGKIGDRIFTVDRMDFLLITHSHIDHIGSFLSKENEHLKPFIYSNLPTLELLKLKKTDFGMRDDIDELFKQAYVNTKIYFDDVYAEQFLSGHSYGSNFYIENYKQGFSALYITDTNIKSRAFKSKSVKSIGKYDVDILFIEFPIHKYRPFKLSTKSRHIIGTTSGEYEEVLVRINPEEGIIVDENNTMYFYELIRQKYRSYLSKELNEIKVEFGTFREFIKSDYKYFFTTKGYALMYLQKYRELLKKNKIKVYLTNTKTNVEGVKILSLKTHINMNETLDIIKEVKPKSVIFTHYNGSNLLHKIVKKIENIVGQENIFVSNPSGEWVKLRLV